MKKVFVLLFLVFALAGLTGCRSDAEIVSENISKEADQFRVRRRIVFYNAIQDVFLLEIIGNCSIEPDIDELQLEVTCKIGERKYQKHFLGLSDNVTYTVEQLDYSDVDPYRYTIIFKPESIMPITIVTETGE